MIIQKPIPKQGLYRTWVELDSGVCVQVEIDIKRWYPEWLVKLILYLKARKHICK